MQNRHEQRGRSVGNLWLKVIATVGALCLLFASPALAADWTETATLDNTSGNWVASDNGTANPWTFATGQTPSQNVGPSAPVYGTHYIYTEASSPTAGDEWYLTRSNLDADTYDYNLNFWYNKYHNTTTTCNLQVQVNPGGAGWQTPEWTTNLNQGIGGASGTTWLNQSVDLSAYSGTIAVRFKASSGGNWPCDTALDQVKIDGNLACVSSTGPPTIDNTKKKTGNPIDVCDVYDTAGSTLTNISIDKGAGTLYDGVSCLDINTSAWPATAGFEAFNISVTATDNCGLTQNTADTFQYNSCVPTTGPLTVIDNALLSGTTTDVNGVITDNGATISNIKVYEILGTGSDIDDLEAFDGGGLEGWGSNWTATEADGVTAQTSPSTNGDLMTGFFTRSASTGPSEPYDGDFVYYEASTGPDNTDRYLVNSTVYDAGNNELIVTFKYLMNGANVGDLELQVKNPNYNSGAWTTEWSASGNLGDNWKTGYVDLKNGGGSSATAYVSGNTELRFRFTYGGGSLGDIALDDVHILGPRAVNPAALFDGTSAAAQNASTAGWPEGELRVDVTGTNDCGGDLSDWGFINFQSDAVAPTMASFIVEDNGISPVSIFSMLASDNVGGSGIAGYLVKANDNTAPAATDADCDPDDPAEDYLGCWSSEPPIRVYLAATGTVTFYAWAKDEARNLTTNDGDTDNDVDSYTVTVNPDATAPTIDSFTMPSTSFSPIEVSSLAASDDSGVVTGYMITESATAPLAGDAGWLSTPPTSHETALGAGTQTFYAWAKDGSGNVSVAATQDVDLKVDSSAPTVTFDLPTSHDAYSVPVTTFLAGDITGGSANNTGVAGYMITTNSTPPDANDAGWLTSPPSTVTVGSEGAHTFWAWAKDNADNVSSAVSDSVTMALPATCDFEVDMAGTLVQTENYTAMSAPNPWAWDTILTPLADASVQSALNDGSGDLSSGGYILTATGGTGSTPNGSRADYPLFFTTSGTYCIWIRGLDESGSSGGDSNFWGVDGSYVGAMTQATDNEWAWTNGTQNGAGCTTINVDGSDSWDPDGGGPMPALTGQWHTINLWPREQGQKNDMFLITTNNSANAGGLFSGNNDQVTVIPVGATEIDPTCVDNTGGGAPGSGGGGASGYINIDPGQTVTGTPLTVGSDLVYETDVTNPIEYRAMGAQSDGFETFTPDVKWFYTNIGGDAMDPDAFTVAEGQGIRRITGSGAGIGGNTDYFSFNYQPNVTGDFTIDVQVKALIDRNSGTTAGQDPNAKAGIMVRQSLAANSRNVMMTATSTNGVQLQRRASDGGTTATVDDGNAVDPGDDTWLRLTRSGSTFEGFYSSDNGDTWTSIGTTSVSFSGSVLIGLGVTATSTNSDSIGSFDNFFVMPSGTSGMSQTWTDVATTLDTDLPTAWTAQDYAIALRDSVVASGSPYQVNTFSYNPCIDTTPSTLSVHAGQIVSGGAVSLNALFDHTGNATGFSYQINGNNVLNPWNSYAVVPDGVSQEVTFKVSGTDPDCGTTSVSSTGTITVDNTCSDPTPSTITILTGQVTGGSSVDLTSLFSSTGNVSTVGFSYKINGVPIGDPEHWDSRAFGILAAETVSFEVHSVDPDCGNAISSINNITIDNTCVRHQPTIDFAIDEGHVGEGRALPYQVTIRNEDSYNCGPSTFDVDIASDSNNTDFVASYFNPTGSNLNILLQGRESATIELAVEAVGGATEWNSNVTTLEITSTLTEHNTPSKVTGAVTTSVFLVSPITHNSVTTGSTKWSGKWGTSESGSKYGNFDCLVCHEKGGPNIKWMLGEIALSGATWGTGTTAEHLPISFKDAREGPASPANDAESNDWGDDDPDGNDAGESVFPLGVSGGAGRSSSDRACEVCHTQTMYHRYDTSGQTELNHFNGRDCTDCHRHSLGFTAGCTGCHGNPPLESTLGGPNGLADIPGVTGSVTPGTHYKHVVVLGYECEYCHDGWRTVGEMPKEVSYGGDELYQINHKFNIFFDQKNQNAGAGTEISDPVQLNGNYTGQDGVAYEYLGDATHQDPASGVVLTGTGTLTCENIYCHGGTESMGGTNPQWNGNIACNSCHGTSAKDTPPGYSHTTHVGKMNLPCSDCHAAPAGKDLGYNGHVNGRVQIDMSNLPDSGGTPVYNGVNGTLNGTVWESNADGSDLPPSATYGTCSNVACHYGTETPVWNGGIPANCTTCHNDGEHTRSEYQDPDFPATQDYTTEVGYLTLVDLDDPADGLADEQAAYIAQQQALFQYQHSPPNSGNHEEHVHPEMAHAGDSQAKVSMHNRMIHTYVNRCESCHGGGSNTGDHPGHIDFQTTVGGGMTWDGSTCTSMCHDARYITWGDVNPLDCQACHMSPYLGPTVVDPDGEGTGIPTNSFGSHMKTTKAETINASTDWNAQCRKCHPYHYIEDQDVVTKIPLPPTNWSAATGTSSPLNGQDMQYRLGLQFPVSQGIHLGGTATGSHSGSGYSGTNNNQRTEADICWDCHGADDTINEWGYNTDTNDIGGTYPATVIPDINAVSQGSHNYGWLYEDAAWTTLGSGWIDRDGFGYYRKDAYQHEAATNYIQSRRVLSVHSADFDQTLTTGSSVNNNINGDGTLNTTNSNEKPEDIRCTYCHDVHDLNRAVFDLATGQTEVFSGPPYLRNSWMGNPYAPDEPPSSSYSYPTTGSAYSGHNAGQRFYTAGMNDLGTTGVAAGYATPRLWPTVSLQKLGGFFIDQNSNHPVTKGTADTGDDLTLAETSGICTMCHGSDVDNMDYYSSSMWRTGMVNGHSNSTIGGTGANKRNIFDAQRGGTSYHMAIQDGVNVYRFGKVALDINNDVKDIGIYNASSIFRKTAKLLAADAPPRNIGWYGGTVGSTSRGGESGVWYSGNTTTTDNASIGSAGVTSRAHDFTCSKCHSPHATGLPALLITNCLDLQAASWEKDVAGDTATVKIGPKATNTYAKRARMTCHSKEGTSTGWNKLAPLQ